MKMRFAASGLLALGLFVGVGCTGGSAGSHDWVQQADAEGPFDGDTAARPGRDLDTVDPHGPDDGRDWGDTPAEVDGPTALPGEFGWPCTENRDCLDNYCVSGYTGQVCTKICSETVCPDGWSCQQDLAARPDVIFLCVPSFPRLCYPCRQDAECRLEGDSPAHACLPAGDAGSFCGAACAEAVCPQGFFCAVAADHQGVQSQQCRPEPLPDESDPALCRCSPGAIAAAAGTVCYLTNDIGRCAGQRICTTDGLSACDAPVPAADVCDGRDNDCDGAVDEEHVTAPCTAQNEFGQCTGVMVCRGTDGARCDAPLPAAEVCDLADNDCDGQTDEEDAQGCQPRFADLDGDGFGIESARCLCGPDGDYSAATGDDCDDASAIVYPGAAEICNGVDDNCSDGIDEEGSIGCSLYNRDEDGDGFGQAEDVRCLCAADDQYSAKSNTDCDDQDAQANPGQSEICDGKDNDCDGTTDEAGAGNCSLFYVDEDNDGHGNPAQFACLCQANAQYPTAVGGDCNDARNDIAPQRSELCDGVDNDCDGLSDEAGAADCLVYLRDNDDDGYGLEADSQCLCAAQPPYTTLLAGDCDDDVAEVHPQATEQCNGLDDDCNATIDDPDAEGCTRYQQDQDVDSYGVGTDSACLCAPSVPYVALNDQDCNDANPFVHPGAHEVCNGLDDDCNGDTDEGVQGSCSAFYRDVDDDGWGLEDDSLCLCAPEGEYRAVAAGDCDDSDPTVYPYAAERCNEGIDDDCDGVTDEIGAADCQAAFRDEDQDGYGLLGDSRCLCAPAAPYGALQGGDCDDAVATTHPSAPELCDEVDNDCDGTTDEAGAQDCIVFLRDGDSDTWGVSGESLCLCSPEAPYSVLQGGDCNDANPLVHPTAEETCNGLDDNCNGAIDEPDTEGCTTYYEDADHDTWGIATSNQCLCAPQGNFTAAGAGDCNDSDPATNPAAVEVCNGSDNDCDEQVDEAGAVGCDLFLRDEDSDNYGVTGDFRCLCQPAGVYHAEQGGDCQDNAATVHPQAVEVCNAVDDDCDGDTDESGATGCIGYLRDVDEDGFGVTGDSRCLCAPDWPYTAAVGGDCNDSSDLIHPEATEYCNATDDDCDALIDQQGAVGCTPYFADQDDDGWGTGTGRCLCTADGDFTALKGGDCADQDPLRNPGLPERCAVPVRDEDCDGQTDEVGALNCTTVYADADNDGYGSTSTGTCLCNIPVGYVAAGGDCRDNDVNINPGKTEVCNASDDNCSGVIDEGCGLASGSGVWPTYKYNTRRSGHSTEHWGPADTTHTWIFTPPDGQYGSGWATINSPIIVADGNIVVQIRDWLYKLRRTTGAILWKHQLPAAAGSRAGPSLRQGGTILAPAGNGLVMLRPAIDPIGGQEIAQRVWTVTFEGPSDNTITCSPMIDSDGNAYVANSTNAHRVNPNGAIAWSINVPNSQGVAADMAIGPAGTPGAGRIYFGSTNHVMYAVNPDGFVAWTFFVPGSDVDSSVGIGRQGRIYLNYGQTFVSVQDLGSNVQEVARVNVGSGDNDTSMAIFDDGSTDWFIQNPNGCCLYRIRHLTSGAFCTPGSGDCWVDSTLVKHGAGNSTPVVDRNGVAYVGTDNDSGVNFFAINLTGSNPLPHRWEYNTGAGVYVDGTAAIGQGWVVVVDNSNRVRCIGCAP